MPVEYLIGDRVRYSRANNEEHSRNGQEGVVISVTGDGYVELQFTTPNRCGSYRHMAAIRNIYMLSSPYSKEEAILRTIRKLQKRQYFYQHTGKDLLAWQHLENSA